MAGKKKAVVDDSHLSKTARASKGKKKDEGFIASGDMERIIPLCNGEWAYVLDPRDGKTHHVRVNSEKWSSLIGPLLEDPKHGTRIQVQIAKLGW
jgi:hypothetical protein